MNFINLNCPPLPYFIVGGGCAYRPGDIHARRTIKNVFDLIYVHSGTLYLEQEPFNVELGAGQFFIIIPDTPHRGFRVCQEKTVTTWIHFYTNGKYSLSDEFYPDNITRRAAPKFYYSPQNFILSIPRTGTVPEADREKLERYLQRMNLVSFSKYTQKKSFPQSMRTPFEIQQDFIEFLQILYAPYCCNPEKEGIAQTLHDYMDVNYAEDISLTELARQYSYSTSHLIRSFRKSYSLSPMQYLKKLRIEHAAELLLKSDATIQDIGEMVGLRIPSYFIRIFKQQIGVTPAQYRAFYAKEHADNL